MDEAFGMASMMLMMALLLPVMGILMAVTPYLQRRGEVFAVTVPASAQRDPYLRGLKRRYAFIMGAVTAVLTAAGFAAALAEDEAAIIVVLAAGTLAIMLGGYALMLRYRAKTKAYKRAQGWEARAQEAVAVVGEGDVPRAISLAWNLLYLPIILITVGIAIVGYPHMPDMIPMHANFDGTVNDWAPKGPMVVAFPVLVQLFLAATMAFSHWTILKSKKWAEPGAPATSALAYGLFARAQSVFLLVTGLLLTGGIGILFELAAMEVVSLGQAGLVIMALAVPIVVGSLVLGVVYGQAGSRVFKRMQGSDTLLADDDEHWKLGIFYVNPDDPAFVLPERFGVGWTFNFARPATWAIVAGILVVTTGFIVAVMALV
ncbi:DUF1648 domain-containing protein [Arabiibacter massiliensis]|uniref:DUF1648 domain-containing protein n=1 Tax=Arabiibacter massiliensis TaxID=1870985 RepID=UPI001E570A9F|nr:DUF1648 domain-containing protein [Arabiibacter massiliensis]